MLQVRFMSSLRQRGIYKGFQEAYGFGFRVQGFRAEGFGLV